MLSRARREPPSRLFPVLWVLLVYLAASGIAATAAGDTAPTPGVNSLTEDFEGLAFVGPYGVEGEDDPGEDVFTFEDGLFSSKTCLQWVRSPPVC